MNKKFLKYHSFTKKLSPNAPIFYKETVAGGIQCEDWIEYREDGSLKFCDYDFYHPDGVKGSNETPPTRSLRPKLRGEK